MFKIALPAGIIVSIDSDHPDKNAPLKFEQVGTGYPAAHLWRDRISKLCGCYGHIIGDATTPLDLYCALKTNKILFEILEGSEILDILPEKLPDGARY
jgi:hypothetical protein